MPRALPVGIVLLALIACKHGGNASPAPSASQLAPAPAPAPSASVAPAPVPAPPPAATVACKGVTKQKLTALTAQAGEFGGLAVRGDHVYLLAFDQPAARATLKRVGRDGEGAKVIGHSKSPGRISGLVVDADAAYFVHGKALVKLPIAGGEASTLRENVIRPIALAEGSLWYVECNSGEKKDQLMSLPRTGGEPAAQASWPRTTPGKACQYGDVVVTTDDFFVDDWTSRKVLAISRKDRSVRELAGKMPFPGRIAVEASDVVFQASGGLYRVPKAGGEAKKISELGSTPFHFFAWDESQFFVFNGEAYGMRHILSQLPKSGGRGKEIEWFQVQDVVVGSGVSDIAVDDSCIYLAKGGSAYVEVLAKPKPAAP
ncbi:MAG: hypothetical protein HYZ29_09800 [Myxococcales bacterium]|nr:hypothetical protein [Myxococcales bacterium]